MKNMLVLFDTNIILDILEKRLPFYNSSKSVLETCVSGNVTGYIALHSISNIYYILRKRYSAADRRQLLLDILDLLQVASADHESVRNALKRNDFPDRMNVQYRIMRTISSQETRMTLKIQMFLPSLRRIF